MLLPSLCIFIDCPYKSLSELSSVYMCELLQIYEPSEHSGRHQNVYLESIRLDGKGMVIVRIFSKTLERTRR